MIRLTLALLATMFVTFMIAGADRGQVRYGLIAETRSPQTITPAVQADEVTQAVFVPSQPLILAPLPTGATATETDSTDTAASDVTEVAAPQTPPDRLVRFIAVNSANVREGPSKDFAVVERLSLGEAVTVLTVSDDPEGWTLITIEGDGLEGYVSNALLADQP